MIDLILFLFAIGMFAAGWHTHKKFGSVKNLIDQGSERWKAWVKSL